VMAFLMTVLIIQFIVKTMIDKSKPKNKDVNMTEATGVKHPAEFMLRQNDKMQEGGINVPREMQRGRFKKT